MEDKSNEWWIEELEKPCPHYTSFEGDVFVSLRRCRACDMCMEDLKRRLHDSSG